MIALTSTWLMTLASRLRKYKPESIPSFYLHKRNTALLNERLH
ncbi:hypothetical protein [Pseudomonas sp. NUPR-001]